MFDNIIAQDRIISLLKDDIAGGLLPRSMLFYGTDFCGKTSTALELARILSCRNPQPGQWGCQCSSCQSQLLLEDPSTLITGPRYFLQDIRANGEVFRQTDQTFSRFMFIRAVRRLLRRFDPLLWEGEEQKLKKIQGVLQDTAELMEDIEPNADLLDDAAREKICEKIYNLCASIISNVNLSHIPVHQIRNINFWVHTSTQSRVKTIVLEGAQYMQESARNALLKTLEEPPDNVYFILLASNRGAIIPTILSRVRQYGFTERDTMAQKTVLQRIFRESSDQFTSLKEYFYAFDFSLDKMRSEAALFLERALDPDSGSFDAESMTMVADKKAFVPFLESLSGTILHRLRESGSDTRLLRRFELWIDEINRSRTLLESFNQSHLALAERLFYTIRSRR